VVETSREEVEECRESQQAEEVEFLWILEAKEVVIPLFRVVMEDHLLEVATVVDH
jgi:hypothetical protein